MKLKPDVVGAVVVGAGTGVDDAFTAAPLFWKFPKLASNMLFVLMGAAAIG
jgi:hypothetical protein